MFVYWRVYLVDDLTPSASCAGNSQYILSQTCGSTPAAGHFSETRQAVRWRFPSDLRYLPAMAKLGYIRRSFKIFKRPVSVGYDINDILISFMYPMVLQVWPAIDHFFPMDARRHSRKHPNHLNFSQAEGNARSAPPSQLIGSWYLDLTWF